MVKDRNTNSREHLSFTSSKVLLVQKEHSEGRGKSLCRECRGAVKETWKIMIISLGGMCSTMSSVAAEHGFSLQNKILNTMRIHLSKAKTQNLMAVASVLVSLDAIDHTQPSTH